MKNIHVFTADVDRTLRNTGAGIPGPMTLSAFEKLHLPAPFTEILTCAAP